MVSTALIDSSVWVRHLRGDRETTDRLRPLLADRRAVICPPVSMELRAGARVSDIGALDALLNRLPVLQMDVDADFRGAAELMRKVRANGHTVRAVMDGLIAAIAIRHGCLLLHDDIDFVRIAEVAPLRHERWSGARGASQA